MNFFKMKTSWSNLELGLFKLCVGSAFVLVGAYFHQFIQVYYVPIIVIFVISTIAIVYLWLQKIKTK